MPSDVLVTLPAATEGCKGVAPADFDEFLIPHPPCQYSQGKDGAIVLSFSTPEEAIKYALHLGDVHDRMQRSEEFDCARTKIKQIIGCVNNQIDFSALSF